MNSQTSEKKQEYTRAYSHSFKSFVTITKTRYNKGLRIYDCIVYDAELNESFPCMFTDMELSNFE